jgi:hypothetical protein
MLGAIVMKKGFISPRTLVLCRAVNLGFSEAMESSKEDPHPLGARSCGPERLLFRFEFPLN